MSGKIKTKRAAAKRFTTLKSGKIKRSRAYGSHILTKKDRSRKNDNKKADFVSKADMYRIKICLPIVSNSLS